MHRLIVAAIGIVLLGSTTAFSDTSGGDDLNQACRAALDHKDLDGTFADCPRQRDGGPISDEDYARLFVMRGAAFEERRDFEHAIRDFNQAVALAPTLADAFHQRANAYDSLGQHGRAIADYDAAIRLEPKNALILEDRCVAYSNLGKYDRALQDCDAAIALDAHYGNEPKGRILFYQGEYAKAADAFAAAFKGRPDDTYAPIWEYLATRRAGGDGNAALQAEAKTLKLNV